MGIADRQDLTSASLQVPGFTAYIEPSPEAMEVAQPQGVTGWKDAHQTVDWYGQINVTGSLHLAVTVHLPSGEKSRLRLSVGRQVHTADVTGGADAITVDFGNVEIQKTGYYCFALEGVTKTGATFGDIHALLLSGPAAEKAHFNLEERRNAASVHLGYPLPDKAQAEWFYNEVTAISDPIASYYMACGFRRGYFGIQVNSPTERRIIFSVWDSGNEAVDRGKVDPENRVQLLAKGDGVFASDFGNEGTGGHSHLVYPWKTGHTYRFLVHAQPQGTHTTYSAYFYFPERHQWGLIARFRAPKDGEQLRGLYSFNEDFDGANGQKRRMAEFGPGWVRFPDGTWKELTTARFTHDPTGKEQRKDYNAGVIGGRFYLSNGGFVPGTIKYGDKIERPATGTLPVESLPSE